MTYQTKAVRIPRDIKALLVAAGMIVVGILACCLIKPLWLKPEQQLVTGDDGIPTFTLIDPYHWVGPLGFYTALAGAAFGVLSIVATLVRNYLRNR